MLELLDEVVHDVGRLRRLSSRDLGDVLEETVCEGVLGLVRQK